jgi:PAS domain S-box-containing protein
VTHTAGADLGAVARLSRNANNVGVVLLSPDGSVFDANEAFLAMLGYTRADLAADRVPWPDLTPPKWNPATQQAIDQLRAQGRWAVFEKEYVRKDQSRVAVLIAAVSSGTGETAAFVFDVTARTRAEAALANAEQQLHAVLSRLPISLFAFDRLGIITLAAGRGLEDRGFRPGELVGRSAFDLHRNRPDVLRSLRRALGGESVAEVSQLDELAFEVHYTPVFEAGEVVGVNGVAINVTGRKEAEDALRDAEARFRTYVDHATDALFVYDERASILDVNRRACEILGYSREELIGKTPELMDPAMGRDAVFRERNRQRFLAGEMFGFETSYQRKDGTFFPVEVRVRPFEHRGQRFALALALDITERRRVEEERERVRQLESEREAAIANERTRLAGEIHDTLAQGLAMIVMQLADAEAKLGAAWAQAEKPLNMVRELAVETLAYARRSVTTLRPDRPAGGLPHAIRDIVDSMRRHFVGSLTLTVTGATVLLETAVESALASIARAALTNAVRHSRASRISVELDFGEQGAVRLVITDDGIGFDANAVPPDAYGLISMQERATRAGVALTFVTEPGAGTVLVASWSPVPRT